MSTMNKEFIILLLITIFAIGIIWGDQQTRIYSLQVDMKNLKSELSNSRSKEITDNEYLRQKWYEIDQKVSYK